MRIQIEAFQRRRFELRYSRSVNSTPQSRPFLHWVKFLRLGHATLTNALDKEIMAGRAPAIVFMKNHVRLTLNPNLIAFTVSTGSRLTRAFVESYKATLKLRTQYIKISWLFLTDFEKGMGQ